jgi:capsular exopolysaccharide synthesis family protein
MTGQSPLDTNHAFDAALEPDAAGAAASSPAENTARGAGDSPMHLLDYVKVVYTRRWTAVTAFLLVFLSVALHVFTATPIYEARVQILIEKENTNVVTFKEAFEQNQLTDDYYQTQYKLLQSRALARITMDRQHLWTHPLFDTEQKKGAPVRSVVRAAFVRLFGSADGGPPAVAPSASETRRESIAIDRFLAHLTVSPIRNSRLVDVTFESPDPTLSADVANALARAYIDQSLEFKLASSREASDWLGQRLDEQRTRVEASEQALQRYRERTDAVSLEDKQNIVVQKLADLNAAVTRAKTERIQKEAMYNQLKALQNDRAALETFPSILTNAFIQQQKGELADLQRQQAQLSQKLGPRHPEMMKISLAIQTAEAKVLGEIVKVVESTQNDFLAAQAQENSLVAALEQQKRDALELNRKGIDYAALQRDAVSNRQILDGLLQRAKETGIVGELKSTHIRIVDAAEVPRRSSSPNKPVDLLLGLGGGIVGALVLTFFFEYLDNRIKTPEEMRRHLGLAHIGMVPLLPGKAIHNPLINNGVPANFAEAFRTIRTNVLFSSTEAGGRSIVVTSAGPGEGKTLVASNLAIALAEAGQRVLLVDADLRRPRIHSLLRFPREPGLSNVLIGAVEPSEVLRKTDVVNLWVLPAGILPPNPAELLGAARFKAFLGTMNRQFDWVILDTPPVMAVTDPSVVAHLTNRALFVIGADMTSRHAALRALEQLDRINGHPIGGVLNRVDLQHKPYYYSQYYRREYSRALRVESRHEPWR